MNVGWEEWEDEMVEYMTTVDNVLGRALPDGYNEDTPCMRLTLDPVPMVHRPLLWYLVGGVSDVETLGLHGDLDEIKLPDRRRHRFLD